MMTKNQHTILYLFLITFFLWFASACKNKKHESVTGTVDSSKLIIEEKKSSAPKDTVKTANLENIPFTMPKDWVYTRFTNEMKKTWKSPESGFVGIASEPSDGRLTVTVWEYEVKTIEQLLPLFKEDMEALDLTVQYELKKGVVYGLTTQKHQADFKWKARNIKQGDKQKFIAVGSYVEIYDENLQFLDTIFNSIGTNLSEL